MIKTKGTMFALAIMAWLAAVVVIGACAGSQGTQGERGLQGERGPQGERGAQGIQGPPGSAPSQAELKALVQQAVAGEPSSAASIARGGRLYDKWWSEVPGASQPTTDHPLWALQTTNKRTGADTQRCKECHGWDYKGKGGAYGKGSHITGFPGVIEASQSLSRAQLVEVLRGATDYRHNFSALGDAALTDLANFMKEGLINETLYVDYTTKKPVGANATEGKAKYDAVCASCHGADGKLLNFGSAVAPEYVGTLAADNPWEFLHKVRTREPGTSMPSALTLGWSIQDALNVLAHAQTLPAK